MDTVLHTLRGDAVRTTSSDVRHRRVRRARTFFIITVLAALVAFSGHCLPGNNPDTTDEPTTQTTLAR